MSDRDFALLMRKLWGWLAYAVVSTTGLLAVLFATGIVDLTPTAGTGMGFLGVLAVVSAGCWLYWRGETGGAS